MITTPTDARNLWCPFARVPVMSYDGDYLRFAANRGADAHGDSCCIADRCMAWRWSDVKGTVGFCGAAGRPLECD
jgi:hypothetical protein